MCIRNPQAVLGPTWRRCGIPPQLTAPTIVVSQGDAARTLGVERTTTGRMCCRRDLGKLRSGRRALIPYASADASVAHRSSVVETTRVVARDTVWTLVFPEIGLAGGRCARGSPETWLGSRLTAST
jgi:hypothetical protein